MLLTINVKYSIIISCSKIVLKKVQKMSHLILHFLELTCKIKCDSMEC